MNAPEAKLEVARTVRSVCPHDCPSTCALDIDINSDGTMGRVRGAKDDPYTAGVICEKVARYAERYHHPKRLLHPLRRTGSKGGGQWQRISWDEALDEISSRFLEIERTHGPEAIWPYYYAGTMGHVHRDGIDKLRHARGYSGQYTTICSHIAAAAYTAGTGKLAGVNPEKMADADCVVIWGTNPVHTQVNVMTHAMRAKKKGGKLVVIDIYRTATMAQADMGLILRPGTDGALALAVMHILLRDGLADRDYLERMTDFSEEFEAHVMSRTPEWASAITGLDISEIEAFARLVGETKATYFRLGYGFTRQRNGITNMHAALCIPAVTGAWQHDAGGAFHTHSGNWALNERQLKGEGLRNPETRVLDMSRIGPVLTGDADALQGGGPVKALLIQNTNPVVVTPDQKLVREGFEREDLFVVVHEQFMTETAAMADIVLPATMFVEHNDYYTRGGHTRILVGPRHFEPAGECWSNHRVLSELADRLGCEPGLYAQTDLDQVEQTFTASNYGDFADILRAGYVDKTLPEDKAAFRDGFSWPEGRFRFEPDWEKVRQRRGYRWEYDPSCMPRFADFFDVNEPTDDDHPFRLATSPSRTFLNTSFTETPGSRKREGKPRAFIRPDDAGRLGIADEDVIQLGNRRGQVTLNAAFFEGIQSGVVIVETLHRNDDHPDGQGINTLIGSDPAFPFGGAAFHDASVWVRKAAR